MLRRTPVAVAGILVFTALVAAGLWLLLRDGATPSTEPETAAPDSSEIGRSSQDDAPEVYRALSRLSSDPDSLVAASVRDLVGSSLDAAIPAGSVVFIDETSWAPDGLGGGLVTATITPPGVGPVTYLVVMVLEEDGWKILSTVSADPS